MPIDRKRRILIVDDDTDSADLMAEAMQFMGYDTMVAYDGQTALERAGQFRPDVALIDLVMADIDGYAVAAALRQSPATSTTGLIAVSASAQARSRLDAISSGFNQFIVKPVAISAVLNAIQMQLDHAQAT